MIAAKKAHRERHTYTLSVLCSILEVMFVNIPTSGHSANILFLHNVRCSWYITSMAPLIFLLLESKEGGMIFGGTLKKGKIYPKFKC